MSSRVWLFLSWAAASGLGVCAGVAGSQLVAARLLGAAAGHGSGSAPTASAIPSPEEWAAGRERAIASHVEIRHRFAEEARDPAWSPGAISSFRADFEALAARFGSQVRVTVTGIDCRTTLCKVDLAWATYAEARRAHTDIIRARYKLKCARDIYLPPPDDLSAAAAPSSPTGHSSYVASVVFDCAEAREDG
jgi:hypothetical protein